MAMLVIILGNIEKKEMQWRVRFLRRFILGIMQMFLDSSLVSGYLD